MNNCAHEQVFKALARVDAKLATATVKGSGPHKVAHQIRQISEYFIPSGVDSIQTTFLGKPKVSDWLPSEFGSDRTYWEKKGLAHGKP